MTYLNLRIVLCKSKGFSVHLNKLLVFFFFFCEFHKEVAFEYWCYFLFYLEGRVTASDKNIHSLGHYQMASTAKFESGWSQEPRTPSVFHLGSRTWISWTIIWCALEGSWMKSCEASTVTWMGDAHSRATTPAPETF